jgi:hypothetical protein
MFEKKDRPCIFPTFEVAFPSLLGNKKTAKTVGRKILRGGQETQNVVAPLPVLAV